MITKEDILNNEVRALTWKQPYASLMLHGKIETRAWDTKYRGLVLICSGKTVYTESQMIGLAGAYQAQRALVYLNQNHVKEPKGVAIAIGRLWKTREMQNYDGDDCFVGYNPKLYAHIYRFVTPIEPFEWKGSQGWRILNDEQKKLIKLAA